MTVAAVRKTGWSAAADAVTYTAWITAGRWDAGKARMRRGVHAGRDAPCELVREPVAEDRAEDGDADRAADLADERRAGGGHAEQPLVDRVLGREHEHLHHQSEAEPEDQQVRRRPASALRRRARPGGTARRPRRRCR